MKPKRKAPSCQKGMSEKGRRSKIVEECCACQTTGVFPAVFLLGCGFWILRRLFWVGAVESGSCGLADCWARVFL